MIFDVCFVYFTLENGHKGHRRMEYSEVNDAIEQGSLESILARMLKTTPSDIIDIDVC